MAESNHAPLIEQLEAWAHLLEMRFPKTDRTSGGVVAWKVIVEMRQVAADLRAADNTDEDEDDDDDGCPKLDPDCMSRADECHDACEYPADLKAEIAELRRKVVS